MNAPASALRSRAVIATAAALGLGLIGYALFSRQTDEERIAELLTGLEESVSFEAPPNPLTHAATLRGRFAELVAQDVVVQVPERSFVARGRDDLTREGIARIQDVFVSTGAVAAIEASIDSLTDIAIAAIKTAEVPAEARGALVELAQFVAWREA